MANPACPTHMHASVYQKIIDDDVGDALKADVLDLCAACDAELGDIDTSVQSVFNNYCQANRDSGNALALGAGEIVGHIKMLDGTCAYLSKVLNLDSDRVAELFRWLAGEGSPSQIDEAADWFVDLTQVVNATGDALVISGPVCWLFREDGGDARSLFDDAPECLPCRLGLPTVLEMMPPYPSDLTFIGMTVRGALLSNPRSATVFHGDYISVREIWLPGGMTQPIALGPAHCVAMGGVAEFVANPPKFSEIDANIRILTT